MTYALKVFLPIAEYGGAHVAVRGAAEGVVRMGGCSTDADTYPQCIGPLLPCRPVARCGLMVCCELSDVAGRLFGAYWWARSRSEQTPSNCFQHV
jgi:hypothetical protein